MKAPQRRHVHIKAASQNVISAKSRNLEPLDITGLPLEFTPYLIGGGSDKLIIMRGSLNICLLLSRTAVGTRSQ